MKWSIIGQLQLERYLIMSSFSVSQIRLLFARPPLFQNLQKMSLSYGSVGSTQNTLPRLILRLNTHNPLAITNTLLRCQSYCYWDVIENVINKRYIIGVLNLLNYLINKIELYLDQEDVYLDLLLEGSVRLRSWKFWWSILKGYFIWRKIAFAGPSF